MPVHVEPMSDAVRAISARWRPAHPPLFEGDCAPSPADIELALALLEALDAESFAWFGGAATVTALRKRLTDAA